MNHIKVMFFATLRDKAGVRSTELDLQPAATIEQLKRLLVEKYPNLNGLMDHCLASINHEYCFDESEIPLDAEIAFFPPVSGGCR
ncbi:MAG: MoaD/ThiS family protein [Chloroflexi bacterium]|nr:MoaD/ThiS family protein [Chloroflexota bacterium]